MFGIHLFTCLLKKTSIDLSPYPNYWFKVTRVELYTDPGNANQTERIEGRNIVNEDDMNNFKFWKDTERRKDVTKEVQV